MLHDFLVHDFVHDLEPLDGLLLGDADELLLQGDGAEAVVEEVEPLGGVDAEEGGHVLVVREGGAEAHQPHILLGGLDVPDGSVTHPQVITHFISHFPQYVLDITHGETFFNIAL